MVVINGPDATAGSTFNLCIIKGINAPEIVATVSVAKIDMPTKIPRNKVPFQINTVRATTIPHIAASL